jgi:hypothetical protein
VALIGNDTSERVGSDDRKNSGRLIGKHRLEIRGGFEGAMTCAICFNEHNIAKRVVTKPAVTKRWTHTDRFTVFDS